MATALEGGYDLGGLALCLLALGALLVVRDLTHLVSRVFDVSFLGLRPFHGVAVALENVVVATLDDAIKGVERLTAKFLSGLIDAWGMLIAIPALAVLGMKAALEYLWDSALKPTIRAITNPIKNTADQALSKVKDVAGDLAATERSLEAEIAAGVKAAIGTSEAFARSQMHALEAELGADIATAIRTAERYADEAIGRLRAAEDAAVAGAVGLAAEAKVAGQAAAAAVLAELEGDLAIEIRLARAAAAAAVAELDRLTGAAIGELEGAVITVGRELHEIEGDLGALGTAGLIATIPAIATLVHAIADEAGLGRAECRGKVKQICSTDPNAWSGLLAGLVGLGFVFSLRELAEIANPIVHELADVIGEAA